MFSNLLTDAVVVVITLGVLIFVHELGHFLAAKWFGVRVVTFSFGMGKRLFGIKRGDTDYRVSLLPFGGYVKMAGDDPSKPREGDTGEYLSKPRWQRFIIVAMGPTMNAIMAVALLTGLYRFHFQKLAFLEQPARVGDIDPDSPAARAGLQPEDVIVGLDGLRDPKWEDVAEKVLTSAGEALPVEVLRGDQRLNLSLTPLARGRDQAGDMGWYPYLPAVIDKVEPGFPAAQSGLKPGDEIVALEGRRFYFQPRLSTAIRNGNGKSLDLTLRRDGKEFPVRISPVRSTVNGEQTWRIGIRFSSGMIVRQLPWKEALTTSIGENLGNCLLTFEVLEKVLTRRMSARMMSGPIGIALVSGESFRAGMDEMLHFVAVISLQLAIVNLLPIPILDGGVILLLMIESVLRRDLSLQVKERVIQLGFVVLLLLAVFITYNDIMKTLRPS